MQTIALWVAKWLLSYVRRHPEFLLKLAPLIPGKLDDEALAVLVKLLKLT